MTAVKKSNDIPTIIMTGPENCEKMPSFKKYVLIAGTAVFILAIILTAILVGMHIFSDAQKQIVKFALSHEDGSKEDVTSDPNDNTVEHHVISDSYELWVVDDFSRNIRTMKIRTADGIKCYVAALNRTTSADPLEILKYKKSKAPNATYYVTYRAASDPILDTSFLCKKARDACEGISTYWLFLACSDSTELIIREKRDAWNIAMFIFKLFADVIRIICDAISNGKKLIAG